MVCEVSFRSKQGKTVVLRVYSDKVEVTGDFFTSEEDLEKLEKCLANGNRECNVYILGVEITELFDAVQECRKSKKD
ncbi:hypothetical protein [Stygiolobus caldivivus]|uniref:Uncharacterized protein n=1 Tax=Stygiolobus caldivivus TaxID=2824673 RepID=A0A8D5U4S9_9CREN|nr:hypothetical protein [Stygiolobus caldivivus]BCU69098.1 hypothetical protein KN1_03950 [Stygiolobus caldivivus]